MNFITKSVYGDYMMEIKKVRTMFLSDFHLGTRGAQADYLIDFLRYHEAEIIYLVGDVFDGWRLKNGWYWPQSHNDVVQKLLRQVRKGAKIIYIPGNHDEVMRNYLGTHFGGIEIMRDDVHQMVDGRRMLILHGDEFDTVIKNAKWLAFLGDHAYVFALTLNTYFNKIRRWLNMPYWSLSAYLKAQVKNAVSAIGKFEDAVAKEAERRGVQAVLCGHIHTAANKQFDDIEYYNSGDWVESCTAILEHYSGEMELVTWQHILHEDEAVSEPNKDTAPA